MVRLGAIRVSVLALAALAALAMACGDSGESEEPASEAPASTSTPVAAPTSTPTPSPKPTPSGLQRATVSDVVDGDTIGVVIDGQEFRLRLILIDTPEVFGGEECFGREASTFAKSLTPVGTDVALERDVSETDRFDRLLRYVYLPDGRMMNEVLVREGYARLSIFPPDVKYVDRIRAAEAQARDSGSGLWSACVATATPTPTRTPPPQATQPPRQNCDPSYPSVCIPRFPPDLDCGEIPFRRFTVLQPDPHGFDRDRNGIGCESG